MKGVKNTAGFLGKHQGQDEADRKAEATFDACLLTFLRAVMKQTCRAAHKAATLVARFKPLVFNNDVFKIRFNCEPAIPCEVLNVMRRRGRMQTWVAGKNDRFIFESISFS